MLLRLAVGSSCHWGESGHCQAMLLLHSPEARFSAAKLLYAIAVVRASVCRKTPLQTPLQMNVHETMVVINKDRSREGGVNEKAWIERGPAPTGTRRDDVPGTGTVRYPDRAT